MNRTQELTTVAGYTTNCSCRSMSMLPSAALLWSEGGPPGSSDRGFCISGIWHGLLGWSQFSDILRTRGRTYTSTMVGIEVKLYDYFFVQFYLYVLTIFHVRISHTVGLHNVFPLFKFNTTRSNIFGDLTHDHKIEPLENSTCQLSMTEMAPCTAMPCPYCRFFCTDVHFSKLRIYDVP